MQSSCSSLVSNTDMSSTHTQQTYHTCLRAHVSDTDADREMLQHFVVSFFWLHSHRSLRDDFVYLFGKAHTKAYSCSCHLNRYVGTKTNGLFIFVMLLDCLFDGKKRNLNLY